MAVLPTETVTFLFTDIEGSTRLWEANPDVMRAALLRHNTILRTAIESRGGVIFKTLGDSFCATFDSATAAIEAALNAQRELRAEEWDGAGIVRVRMALHTGEAENRDADYFGLALSRVARLLSVAHGEQVLLSQATYECVRGALPRDARVKDMGAHRLKDLQQPEQIFQLTHSDLPDEFPPLRSGQTFANNLPQQVTSFIGRERQIAEIQRLLAATRLLTIAGAGGFGKTRIALRVAGDVLELGDHAVWLVELAPVSQATLVPQTVASILGLREEPGRPLMQTLIEHLRTQRLLLVLDNCEHLVAACAQFASAVLTACPDVRILATSREALGIPGETSYRIPSLSLPSVKSAAGSEWLDSLRASEAVQLFLERAAQISCPLNDEDLPAVAQICIRLDGIPLAIELAAARMKVMPAEQIAARLDDRFRLLTGGSRTALRRQQTLRALIDWSYDLLDEGERTLLQRLAIFAGGWTLEAAENVCADQPGEPESLRIIRPPIEEADVLDFMTSLVEKSLVVYDESSRWPRYRLLETVREYALEKLRASDMNQTARERHADYFLQLAHNAATRIKGPDQAAAYEQLEAEHGNLRGAMECLLATAPARAMDLVESMKLFWCLRGYLSEGQNCVARALQAGPDAPLAARARTLNTGGVLAWYQADYTRLRAVCSEAHELARQADDRWSMAAALILLGSGASHEGELAAGAELLEKSRPLAKEVGDPWLIAQSLHHSALNAFHSRDLDRTSEFARGALAVSRQSGDKWIIALATRVLGFVALERRQFEDAAASLQTAVRLYQELNYKWGIATSLEGLARVSSVSGDHEAAACLYGAAEFLRQSTGAPLPPREREAYNRDIADLRTKLGDEAFSSAWMAGRNMTLDEAIERALGSELQTQLIVSEA